MKPPQRKEYNIKNNNHNHNQSKSNTNGNGNGNGNANNFTNKRLLTDLKRSRSLLLMLNKKIMMNFTDSKLPLLNKQAASKISNDN